MPKAQEEALRYALAMLSELLTVFPNQPALLEAADSMDLSDELWLALRILRMGGPDREALRNFLLIHPKTSVLRAEGEMLLLGGNRH
uniref:Uncharacterized protein n=1 Tax=Bosea sp. NBC_00436 TaxID=2969620 RepID=A0A9E8CMF9_9HYPH